MFIVYWSARTLTYHSDQIASIMASDLSSLVFKLLVLSSWMLVGGQNCSLTGTLRYLYTMTVYWTTGTFLYPAHHFYALYKNLPTFRKRFGMTACHSVLSGILILWSRSLI